MVFENLKLTLRTRRSRYMRPESVPLPEETRPEIPRETPAEKEERTAKLRETMNVFSKLGHSMSRNNIRLPPIPSFKPINLAAMDLFKCEDDPASITSVEIRRKPCPARARTSETDSTRTPGYNSILYAKFKAFDPCAPVSDPNLHKKARRALKRRYQSKYSTAFGSPSITQDSMAAWNDDTKLDLKVLEDIVWVRELYADSKQGEPTDEDIIRWYDAEAFVMISRAERPSGGR